MRYLFGSAVIFVGELRGRTLRNAGYPLKNEEGNPLETDRHQRHHCQPMPSHDPSRIQVPGGQKECAEFPDRRVRQESQEAEQQVRDDRPHRTGLPIGGIGMLSRPGLVDAENAEGVNAHRNADQQ